MTIILGNLINKLSTLFRKSHLDAVCRRFGVCEQHHHNALDDAEMCGNLILAFKAALENGIVVPVQIEKVQEPLEQEDQSQEETGLFSFVKRLFN